MGLGGTRVTRLVLVSFWYIWDGLGREVRCLVALFVFRRDCLGTVLMVLIIRPVKLVLLLLMRMVVGDTWCDRPEEVVAMRLVAKLVLAG